MQPISCKLFKSAIFMIFFLISLLALSTIFNLYFIFFYLFHFFHKQFAYPKLKTYLFMYYQKILILTYSEFQTNVKLNLQYFSVIQTTSQFKSLMNSKIFLNFRAFNFGGDEVIFSLANVKIPQLYKQSS